jgi:phosphoenolpyruvate synthase/pyruvate phosphate dikinase
MRPPVIATGGLFSFDPGDEMAAEHAPMTADEIPFFSRALFDEHQPVSGIGTGCIGGKATGLVHASRVLEEALPEGGFESLRVSVPRLAVIGTDVFDDFVERNGLMEIATSGEDDERIAHAFQRADFPAVLVGDLRTLVESTHSPLAVRSSSMLEDATNEPFAGIYSTKMIPNNQPDASGRFAKLLEAVKFVWASTFFRDARGYREKTGRVVAEEKMAVIVQEVVGLRHDTRFYPTISGVARSWNYYPSAPAKSDEGVIDLALGLGKTIVYVQHVSPSTIVLPSAWARRSWTARRAGRTARPIRTPTRP